VPKSGRISVFCSPEGLTKNEPAVFLGRRQKVSHAPEGTLPSDFFAVKSTAVPGLHNHPKLREKARFRGHGLEVLVLFLFLVLSPSTKLSTSHD